MEEDCCLGLGCFDSGWRNAGDASGGQQCSVGQDVRGEWDGERCKGACKQEDCCPTKCSSWAGTCAAKMSRSEWRECAGGACDSATCCSDTCASLKGEGDACPGGTTERTESDMHDPGESWSSPQCCQLKCRSSFDAGVCTAKNEILRSMPDHETCEASGCTEEQCCEAKPTASEWTCWYFGDEGEGWRDSGDTSGTGQCPAGSSARSQHDHHMRGSGAEAFTESECCQRNCW